MKKRIYIYSDSPHLHEIKNIIKSFSPPLNDRISQNILNSYEQIQSQLKSIPVNQTTTTINQTQTFTDGHHTIVLIGKSRQLNILEKILDIFR